MTKDDKNGVIPLTKKAPYKPDGKIIDVFICKLRKKLAALSNGNGPIETVWGRGYVLREPSDREAAIPVMPS